MTTSIGNAIVAALDEIAEYNANALEPFYTGLEDEVIDYYKSNYRPAIHGEKHLRWGVAIAMAKDYWDNGKV